MSVVYQHQLHAHKTHRRHYKRWLIGLIVVVVAVVFGLRLLKPDTKTTQAKVVKHTITNNAKFTHFQKGIFSLDLPKGWTFMGEQKDIYTIYHFRSSQAGAEGNRLMDVYEDSSLPNFSVNRVLPVESNGLGGLATDVTQISDNCAAYTIGTPSGNKNYLPAKWHGVNFLCDMGNTLRNVVGIGSTEGLNTVTLKTPTSTPHHYFITYTENNDKPDYNVLVNAVNSFKLEQ